MKNLEKKIELESRMGLPGAGGGEQGVSIQQDRVSVSRDEESAEGQG